MKTFFLAIALALASASTAFAALPTDAETRFVLNRSATGGPAVQLGSQLIDKTVRSIKLVYDFSKVGGSSAAAISLRTVDGQVAKLPPGALIVDCLIDVVTAPTSGGSATIALGTGQAANDLKTATAYGSYTDRVACIPVGVAANAIKLTNSASLVRVPTITIATSNLTAGKINIFLQYVLSD